MSNALLAWCLAFLATCPMPGIWFPMSQPQAIPFDRIVRVATSIGLSIAPEPWRGILALVFPRPVETAPGSRVLPYTLLRSPGPVDALAVDQAGSRAALVRRSGGVWVGTVDDSRKLLFREMDARWACSSSRGDWLLVHTKDSLQALGVPGGEKKFTVSVPCMPGNSVAVSPDDRWVVWCNADTRELEVRDGLLEEIVVRRTLPPNTRPASIPGMKPLEWADLRFSPDGRHLLVLHSSGPAGSWMAPSTYQMYSVPGFTLAAEAHVPLRARIVEFLSSSELLLAGRFGIWKGTFSESKLTLPDSRNRPRFKKDWQYHGVVQDLAISSDRQRLAITRENFRVVDAVGRSVSTGFSLHVVDAVTLKELWTCESPRPQGHARGSRLVFVDGDRGLLVAWDGVKDVWDSVRQYRLPPSEPAPAATQSGN